MVKPQQVLLLATLLIREALLLLVVALLPEFTVAEDDQLLLLRPPDLVHDFLLLSRLLIQFLENGLLAFPQLEDLLVLQLVHDELPPPLASVVSGVVLVLQTLRLRGFHAGRPTHPCPSPRLGPRAGPFFFILRLEAVPVLEFVNLQPNLVLLVGLAPGLLGAESV